MTLKDYLDIAARHFPSSKWTVVGGENFDGAVLDIDPLQVKICLFPEGYKHFPAGAVTLSLHAKNILIKMFGTQTVTSEGKLTRCSLNAEQFDQAADEMASDLLGTATAILSITEDPPPTPTTQPGSRRPPAPHIPRR